MTTSGLDIERALQRRLRGRAVKVIGLGGVGSAVAQGLTQFLSAHAPAVTTLYLADGDAFEERNRARMAFEAGGNKALAKAHELSARWAGRVIVVPVPGYVTPYNARKVVGERDIVFLAVDNHASRRCVSNRCRRLRDVVLISGGNDGVADGQEGTFGNVMIYRRARGRDMTNPLTRFHPEIARPRDRRPDEAGCMALAQSAPQLLFTNLAVAATMLGAFYAWLAGGPDYEEIFLDIRSATMHTVRRAVRRGRPAGARVGFA